ncbi:MAG: TRAP transporter substrate-binding protein [Pseudooceanicola sp.]|nr:TRAP transporter substrate-binding protein [Pseudooceanicola sp.]
MKLRHAFAATALAAVTLVPGLALAADHVLKLSSPAPLTEVDPLSAWFMAFEKGVEEASGGKIDVQIYPSSQLGPIPATVEGVVMGTIEMTTPAIGFLTGVDPRFQVLDATGLFDSEAHALKTLTSPEVKALLAEFGSGAGVEPLFVLTSGQSNIVSKKPIMKSADLNGLKMRTGGATSLVNKPMETFGVSPVALPLGDVLPGIQTGTIDAATLNMPVSVGFKFADVAKESVYIPGKFGIIGGIISKQFLATVGPELEAVIREQATKANDAYAAKLESGPKALEGAWAKMGGHQSQMSEADYQQWRDDMVKVVEEVVAQDKQMQADYDVLKAAAAAHR